MRDYMEETPKDVEPFSKTDLGASLDAAVSQYMTSDEWNDFICRDWEKLSDKVCDLVQAYLLKARR